MGGISNKAQIQVLALSYTILLHFARYIHFSIQIITFSLGGVLLRFCGRRGIVELGTKMGPSWPLDRPHSVPSGQLFFRRGVAKCFLWHGPVRKRYRFTCTSLTGCIEAGILPLSKSPTPIPSKTPGEHVLLLFSTYGAAGDSYTRMPCRIRLAKQWTISGAQTNWGNLGFLHGQGADYVGRAHAQVTPPQFLKPRWPRNLL